MSIELKFEFCSIKISVLKFQENTSSHPIFFMNDVKFDILKAILEYMYLGEVHITNDHLKDFIRTAEALQIRGLSKDTNTAEETADNTTSDSINIDEDFGRKRQSLDELGQISDFGSNKRLKCETATSIIDEDLEEEEDDMIEEIEMPTERKQQELIRTPHSTGQNVEPKVEMLEYLENTQSPQKTTQIQIQTQQIQQQTQDNQEIQLQAQKNPQIQYCSLDSYTAAANNDSSRLQVTAGDPTTTQYIQPGTSQIVTEYKSGKFYSIRNSLKFKLMKFSKFFRGRSLDQ